jgi:hypothetical protein
LDVPKYQVDGVVAKLQKENFFRRSKILGSSTYLGVSLDGKGFGKNYRNVDELDALIVRVRRQGWQVGPDGKPVQRRRPAQPPQQQGVYQARADAPWNGNGAPGPNQGAPAYRPQQQPAQRPANYQPQYEQPRYEQPQNAPPQYEQPRYQQPQNAPPQYEQPRYQQPQNAPPQYEQPGDQQPQNARPQYEQPRYEQPRYDAPQSQAPAGYQQQQPASAYPYGG